MNIKILESDSGEYFTLLVLKGDYKPGPIEPIHEQKLTREELGVLRTNIDDCLYQPLEQKRARNN